MSSAPGQIEIPPSYPEIVRRILEKEIIEGRLAAGERLSEHELAGRLGVSRTPVREAMRALEAQGLIIRHRGKGSFVARLTTRSEAEALYETRAALEGFLTGRAAENMSDADIARLAELTEAFQGRCSAQRGRSWRGDRDRLRAPLAYLRCGRLGALFDRTELLGQAVTGAVRPRVPGRVAGPVRTATRGDPRGSGCPRQLCRPVRDGTAHPQRVGSRGE